MNATPRINLIELYARYTGALVFLDLFICNKRDNWSHSIERLSYPENTIKTSWLRKIALNECNVT
jgi:hypothetical protein